MDIQEDKTMTQQERQMQTRLNDIRADHVARYRFASNHILRGNVIDAGCGVGYGAQMLAKSVAEQYKVLGVDNSCRAISVAQEHYTHPRAEYMLCDLQEDPHKALSQMPGASTVVCFEVIEHLLEPIKMLRSIAAPRLICSVPNQDVWPWRKGLEFHHRHYTPQQLLYLVSQAGYSRLPFWYTQKNKHSVEVTPVENENSVFGRTIILIVGYGGEEVTWDKR